jgi:exonuclease III|tara:strand:- start:79 stop:282 length:204 start_codon:yes stop_codon:yes gene_type:complete
MQKKIDDAANMWNKTKDLKYKELWYKLIKEFANGPHNTERRVVLLKDYNRINDRRISIDKKSWLNLL